MKGLKKAGIWFSLLSKRLYKKISFLALLALIPVLVVGYSGLAQEDSGIMTIALAQRGSDALADTILEELQGSSQLIRFIDCATPEGAEALVRAGKADCAWIFPDALVEKVEKFVTTWSSRDAFVEVLQRQDNVTLMLAREKLSGILFKYCAPEFYVNYIRKNVPHLDHLSDGELLSWYDAVNVSGNLFSYDTVADQTENGQTYLTAPVRGLLAVVTVLCGLAAAMYYLQDRNRGVFAWMSERKLPWIELVCQLIAVVNMTAVVWLSLGLAGMAASFGRELLVTALYVLCTAAFAMLIRRLCGGLRGLGVALPLLVVGMLVICPVFFDLGALRELQYLFPPTYYVNAVYNDKYLWYMALYIPACAALYVLVGKLFKRP